MTTGIRPEEPYIVCGQGGCKGWTPTKDRITPSRWDNALKRSKKKPTMKTNHTKDEQSEVRGIVEELDNLANIYGWHKDQCAGHSHHPACPVVKLRKMITHLQEQHKREKRNYQELLTAVAGKYEGETRHETALRLIKQAQARHGLSTKE